MIEEGYPRLKGDGHARSIDFRQNIVGKIGHQIEELHSVEQIGKIGPHGFFPQDASGFGYAGGDLVWLPVADKSSVQLIGIIQPQDRRSLMNLVASLRTMEVARETSKNLVPPLWAQRG